MNGDRKLPARPRLEQYREQAKDLIKAFKSGDPDGMRWVRRYHPHLPGRPDTNDRNNVTDSEIRSAKLSFADAQSVIAREHQFESWPKFAKHIKALNQNGSPVARFEAAVDGLITGGLVTLKRLLRRDPGLSRARSTRGH